MSRVSSTSICGYEFTVFLSDDGGLYSLGDSSSGAHGHCGTIFPIKEIVGLKNITSICSSIDHSVCLDIEGFVYTFGSNKSGQLGNDRLHGHTHEPQKVSSIPRIIQISCGRNFTMCLCESRNLYSFGINTKGQLGLSVRDNCSTPTQITSLGDIDFFECGSTFTICKTFNEDVFAWGCNQEGQLGVKSENAQFEPIKCEDWPSNIVDIKCGSSHTLVLTSNQEVYSCGSNSYGQLGRVIPSTSKLEKIESLCEIMRIDCGFFHSMCINNNRDFFVFGDNFYGQLGLQDSKKEVPVQHPSLSNVIDISSKGCHTLVKTGTNEIYAFGNNKHSQLGKACSDYQGKVKSPVQVFRGNEDIWCLNVNTSRAKSARK